MEILVDVLNEKTTKYQSKEFTMQLKESKTINNASVIILK